MKIITGGYNSVDKVCLGFPLLKTVLVCRVVVLLSPGHHKLT